MKNAVSSSKILESQSNTEITNNREQLELESTFAQSTTSNTANPRIFGKDSQKRLKSHREQNYPKNTQSPDFKDNAHSPSLRDTALAVARQSTATKTHPLESTFQKVDSRVNVDCHDFDKSKSRNDNKNAISEKMDSKDNSPSLSLRDDEAPFLSSRASEASVAIHNTNLESSFEKVDSSVDCHDFDKSKSRNDSKNADSSTAKSVGEIFICPIASSLSRLKGLEEFRGDFVSLDHACDKYTILAFYAQEFFKTCDYCHDMAAPKTPIPIAVQTKATLELTR
ncbi:Uncharacterised protein [Helicobacter canis]|uniref:Uncharacterized protein n=1 Tax=Helicobacter canis TaxID=29419 RepID=A0A377J8B9_9HELI|nr:Uncharacterised protein [Helicobacter canis]